MSTRTYRANRARNESPRAREGYTLIELVVSIGIFSIVIAIAMGGFIMVMRTQRQASSLLFMNTNVSEALEQISREIRTGKNFCNSSSTDCNGNKDYAGGCEPGTLAFNINRDGKDELIIYAWDPMNLMITKEIYRETSSGVCSPSGVARITAEGARVTDANFIITGNNSGATADGLQPRVTLTITVEPAEHTLKNIGGTTIQTTVSSRQNDT